MKTELLAGHTSYSKYVEHFDLRHSEENAFEATISYQKSYLGSSAG